MATNLISPNEAADVSSGETSVLFFGGNSPRLVVANPLIPRLFDEVSEGVRSLPRGGAEIGGLLVGPKDHEGGILANEIIPIPIEYRFGPSFRLSSPDLTKIEEAIATAHKDLSKTVVGFYRSRTRGGAEFRDSDQEILLAVELAHAGFATDFHFYLVLSPPARAEMPLGLAVRSGMDWSEFRPYTCHLDPSSVTSDLGDPIEETPAQEEAPQANLEPEPMNAGVPEFVPAEVAAEPIAMNGNALETVVAEPEASHTGSTEPAAAPMAQPDAASAANQEPAPAQAEPETMNVQAQESVAVETESANSDRQEPAKGDLEMLNGDGPAPAKAETRTKASGSGQKKAKAPKSETAKSETAKAEAAAKPRAKKATTTGKAKARTTAPAETAVRPSNPETKVKPQVTPAAAAAVVIEPKPLHKVEPDPTVENLFKMRSRPNHFEMSKLTSRISRKHVWWAAAVVLVAGLATCGYLLFSKPVTPAAVPAHTSVVTPGTKQALALTAERRGTDLVLSWNRDSGSITRASYGMLIIKGKDGRRDIALTPDQLRAGSIVYTPTTDQVEVELSVVAGEQVTKDSVIVFLPRKGDKNAIVTSALTHETAQSMATQQASSAQLNEREGPNGLSSSPPGLQSSRPFSMPPTPAGPQTAGVVHLDEVPPSLSPKPGQTSAVVSAPSPLPAAPQQPASVTEVATARNKASEKSEASPVVVAAVAIDQILPHIPESMKALLSSAKTIEVTVSIDENGKVVKANAAISSRSDAPLVAAALDAAHRWKFRPARVNDRPIASEMVVKFNFAPVK